MKNLILGLSMGIACSQSLAHDTSVLKVQYKGDLNYSKFCAAVVNDDLAMFKRALRSKVGTLAPNQKVLLEKLVSSEGVKCNGFDLVRFSRDRDAAQLYTYLSSVK